MAAKKKTKTAQRVEAQIGLDAISIEGALLSPSWLGRIAQQAAPGQTDSDYSVPKGLSLRDEIGRYWRIAQAYWAEFARGQAGGGDGSALARRLILGLLKECFGFSTVVDVDDLVVDERSYPIGHSALGGRVPIVIAAAGIGLDTPEPTFGEDGRRRTAFGLVQEYLNAEDLALWGIVTDGVTLRIVRDNASLTRPAWIEADLARIFNEERHPDFTALWLLIHESRFGRPDQPVTECALEVWRNAGEEEGTRARDHLRDGVEEALLVLGRGFLSHPENRALRTALQDGILSTREYFNQLLRLIYRLIFLLTVEERGLLHADGDDKAKALYAEGYSLRRLRDRSVKRSAHDRFSDAWEGVKIVIRGVAHGEPRLALPALAGIFASKQCPDLDGAKLENHVLLLAMFRLSWLRDDGALARVNWRDMGPEELGSVYESLLELVPKITKDGREFGWAQGTETKGNARKTSGSYYTPDSLVQVLLDSALDPVIADTIARNPEGSVDALLSLSIVDPACGSGHFLLAAARRLAGHVARLQANGTPSPAEYRHALRQVVSRCIYGVDLNPMAVELCKVSLWMEAVEPGLPLTFLNSHIQHGNSLLGTTVDLMTHGIPDGAWDLIEGDDKQTASALKKRNKTAATGQRSLDSLWSKAGDVEAQALLRAVTELEAAADANAEALSKKESRWDGILDSLEYRHLKFVADAWCSAFVWPKRPGELADAAPTNDLWRQLRDGQGQPPAATLRTVNELVAQYRFFHWHLQFSQIFAKGGFDVVLGNPPWERTAFEAIPYFASRVPEIAAAETTALRDQMVRNLEHTSPALWTEYQAARRSAAGVDQFTSNCESFRLSTSGRTNLFALFADLSFLLINDGGRIGLLIPSALATDTPYAAFWSDIVHRRCVYAMLDFENRGIFFPSVHSSYKFSLFTFGRVPSTESDTRFGFFLHSVAQISEPGTTFSIPQADIALINPVTRLLPVCRTSRDFLLLKDLHEHAVFLADEAAAWVGLTSASTSECWVFNINENTPSDAEVQMREAKSIHQFNHRFATYAGTSEREKKDGAPKGFTAVDSANAYPIARYHAPHSVWLRHLERKQNFTIGAIGYRDVARSTDERTMIAAILPFTAFMQPLNGISASSPSAGLRLVGCLNSFACDFACRQKTPGTHVNVTICNQLPIISETMYAKLDAFLVKTRDWVCTRVLELSYTAWDLESFAQGVGYNGAPFWWNPERRFLLRCELDAAFFHLYGLSREDTGYIMDTFPIVRKNDEKIYTKYRTKYVILEIYDAMAEAARTGKLYQTRLDPPPADSRVAHPTTSAGIVVPFPARPNHRPLPDWDDRLFTEVASRAQLALEPKKWATSLSGQGLGTNALAAVLRNMSGPCAREDVERAVVLALLPRLMLPNFKSASTKREWATIIGSENLAVSSVSSFGIQWRKVIQDAVQEDVLRVSSTGLWEAGADIADVSSTVLDARALVVLAWLATAPAKDTEVTKQMENFHVA